MQALAGKGASKEEALLTDLLEKDFDPEEYDKHMAKVFGDEYYRQGTGAYAENEASVLDAEVQKVWDKEPWDPLPSAGGLAQGTEYSNK